MATNISVMVLKCYSIVIAKLNRTNLFLKKTLSVLVSILIFYGILIMVNTPHLFLMRLSFEESKIPRLWYDPHIIHTTIIWLFLFTLLGIGRFFIIQTEKINSQWWLIGLAFLYAAYGYYVFGPARLTDISSLWFGLIGNIIVVVFASFVVYKLVLVSKVAAFLTIPIIIWKAFAGLIVFEKLRLGGFL